MESIFKRLRARVDRGDLDTETEQLLRDAAGALARAAPGLRPVDFADTSSIPGGETRDQLIAAALAHADAVGATDFMEPVPSTTPRLIVAMGEPLQIINILADNYGER